MNSWVAWGVFAIAAVLLGWVGYHFTVRTLRFVTAGVVLAVAVLVTRYGVMHPVGASSNLVNAFARGMDRLCTVFFRPVLGGRLKAHGRVGWLAIIAVLVVAYRELEVWATRWQPPVIDTSALGGNRPGGQNGNVPGGQNGNRPGDAGNGGPDLQREHDQLVAELRFRLPAVEVRSPPVVPGAATVSGLASVAEDSGAGVGGLAGAVIRLAGMLWPNPRRYRVRIWIEPSDLPTPRNFFEELGQRLPRPAEHSVNDTKRATAGRKITVDLNDPQTGGSIATRTLFARNLDEAAEVVAGYVARQIFKADPTAPAWCVGSFDGGDLAALLCAEQLRASMNCHKEACCARRTRIKILDRAVHNGAAAGVARHELALLHNLEGHHVEALRLHALNREQYPRFYRSRYRLAMSLEMIANPKFEFSEEDAPDLLKDALRSLDRRRVTDNAAGKCKIVDNKLSTGSTELLAAARKELRACRRQLMLWRLIWETFLHRDERAIRKPHWRLRERQRFQDGARVAELLVTVRQSLNGESCNLMGRLKARRAIHVTAAITGDGLTIKKLLKDSQECKDPQAFVTEARRPGRNSEKTRWLPWQRRTPSWEAAYNTACLYAALGASCRQYHPSKAMALWAVASLERVVRDRDCDMERPSDWINRDPDFSWLQDSSEDFCRFLDDQMQKDYPTPGPETTHRGIRSLLRQYERHARHPMS